jgi:hypothetical protein
MAAAVCFKVASDLTMTIVAGDRQHSILLDGEAKPPGFLIVYLADIIVLLPSQRLTGPDPQPQKIDVLLPEFRKKKSCASGSWWWVFNLDFTLLFDFCHLLHLMRKIK